MFTKDRLLIPALALSNSPKRGMELVNFGELGILPILAGSDRGYHASGDILTETSDGRDLNTLWDEFQQTITMHNEERQRLIDLLSFSVTQPIEWVPQAGEGEEFEEASEFGEPRGVRPRVSEFAIGYDFRWYDIAARFTWRFLADATARQVEATNNMVLEADNRLVFRKVMEAIFDNRNRNASIRGQAVNVYPFYNADGTVPPPYKNTTFDGTENHYMVSGGTEIDPGDLEDLARNITEHGYGDSPGPTLMLLAHEEQIDAMRPWRRGDVINGVTSNHDFIPVAEDLTTILQPLEQVQGGLPPNSFRGVPVAGRYGKFLVVQENYVPAGYLVAIVADGPDSVNNPVGIREHANAALRGLRLIKGRQDDYPLIDSFYGRAFGTGVRHRGAGAIMQIKDVGTYEIPEGYGRS